MTHINGKYSEEELVEKPAMEIFRQLGWTVQNCFNEFDNTGLSFLSRETKGDVVLISKLKPILKKINPDIPENAIDEAIKVLTQDHSVMSVVSANREVYDLLKNGVPVSFTNDNNEQIKERVRFIDWNNINNNDFFLASQFWVSGDMYTRRADLIGFVNGLPLIFIELKAIHKRLENAYKDNLIDYKDTIPQLFWYNAFIILSNGSESKIGTITSDWKHFNEWKNINSEGEEGVVSLDTIIKGTCQKERFLDILENFILFQKTGGREGSLIKIIAKNHQYLGVNNAIESFKKIEDKNGRLGVFWHTQGSGKSFSMIFFSQKILRKFYGNYTFLIVTDRIELDEQIYKNFLSVGAVTETEVHAESGEHLKQLLRENHRNIFTLIHKFRTEGDELYPVISKRKDIIVIVDEAHRTQYDTLAMNMRKALPNAAFIAFTATPLIVGEEKTKDTFGDYVSIYSFKDSIDDQSTVPLYYENRVPEVEISNENLSDDLNEIIDEAIIDNRQEEKLKREFAKEYQIITRNERLETIARDIVFHFIERGYQGKAMVVSIDKVTTVRMYDKVQKYWKQYISALKERLKNVRDDLEKENIQNKIKYMKETDMAVVVSSEQNEIEKFRKLGLDIAMHRKKMNDEDLATKFKDPDDPFRIVFVCAMWLTGFDVQSLSTIYLDKPMRNHSLMQTIARANRVFRDKQNGLIVDYIGIFRNLQNALAIYNPGGTEIGYPVKSKDKLLEEFEKAIQETISFCNERDINIENIINSEKLQKIKLFDDAVDTILENEETQKKYLTLSNNVKKQYKAILPDPKADKFREIYKVFRIIADKIISLSSQVDVSKVKDKIEDLLDESITTKEYIIREDDALYGDYRVDLSRIDFESIKGEFIEKRKHIKVEKLKNLINRKLTAMVKLNETRHDFLEKFQTLIDEYNAGAINVEIFFEKLISFAKELDEEEKRGVSENLSEEELAMFDLLYKPDLTKKEKEKVKFIAKKLLEKLKQEKLVLDWRKRQQTRASVLLTIQNILDNELPVSYTKQMFQEKCNLIYQHIYNSYFGQNKSIYQSVMM